MRVELSQITVSVAATIRKAVEVIDRGGLQIALAVDEAGSLKGTITDGDVRRGLLRGVPLDACLAEIMNKQPTVVRPTDSQDAVLRRMRLLGLRQLPVIDLEGRLIGIELTGTSPVSLVKPNWAVLMAGGLGVRLRPLTNDLPKPLIHVGGKAILERAIENLVAQGIQQFFISVNYRADMIESHFGDGSKWGVSISYLHENDAMGTAGALGALARQPEHPMLVMNGDIMTSTNISQMFDFHADMQAAVTVGVFTHEHQVPYGVMEIEGNFVRGIQEKPVIRHFANAGVYVLSPEILTFVAKDTRLDMPDLIARALGSKLPVVAFPIREYWIDIGKHDDLQRAQRDVGSVFPPRIFPEPD